MSVPTKVIIIDDDKPSVTVLTNELKALSGCKCHSHRIQQSRW